MEYKKLQIAILMLIGIFAFGSFGYYFFEDMPLFDSFYMTLITISTVGFSEIKPLTLAGRTITIIIIVTGISVGTYTLGMLARVLLEGELQKVFGRKKLERHILELKNHFIICGFGRIGKIICQELKEDNIDFIAVEENPTAVEELADKGYPFLQMDATSEDALIKAGIMKAKGIVTAVQSDADNVFITLTAKGLRPDIFVLSRASDQKNEAKLLRAGATRVVSPYMIGGRRMAQVLKRPTVVDFIDIATMGNKLGLMMEEARVGPKSGLIGKSLIESNLRKDFGVIIVAIKKNSGEMIFNPVFSEKLEADDVIVVLGKREDLRRMHEIM